MKTEAQINNYGKAIKLTRIDKEMLQMNVAEKAGISVSFLSDIENGKSAPSIKTLSKIADALGVNISDFF